MKKGYIEKDKRKTILLICDDIRDTSGVATMAREIVMGTCHVFNWINLGGRVQHEDVGKVLDLSNDLSSINNIPDANVLIHPVNMFGNIEDVRRILNIHNVDGMMIFTDPRYFGYIFDNEREIRKRVPLMYYNIWDNMPVPTYNKSFYNSCDALFPISRLTEYINNSLATNDQIIKYIPHGVNKENFKPLPNSDELKLFRKNILRGLDPEFVLLFNSKNLLRKNVPNTIRSFHHFLNNNSLSDEEKKNYVLLLHTNPADKAASNLVAVCDSIFGEKAWLDNIVFSTSKLSVEDMNMMYNIADATILLSNTEGWGLSVSESMMADTPVIATVTGGLKDQMDLKYMGDTLTLKQNSELGESINFEWTQHGGWVIPINPVSRVMVGSQVTPFIYEDIIDIKKVSLAIRDMFYFVKNESVGGSREWLLRNESKLNAESMCKGFIEGINETLDKFTPRSNFDMIKI